ncbi:hypothetical protein RvY_10167 [Ramazzottius varieornatus]|uniref:Ribonuclease H2 subunit B n=1 Tax=Ramazzottius varieornatus TaxID=947166 RepID=A0A1D1VJM6_RAMVA|nr:hypothetical protein RvY_10167 [Ramazzottius varieornatus]
METAQASDYSSTPQLFTASPDVRRKVLLVPDSFANAPLTESSSISAACPDNLLMISSFWHPNTGDLCLWAFNTATGDAFQFSTCSSEKCRSWFVGNYVMEDGTLTYLVPVDPLFLVIPFLLTAKKKRMFQPVSQILVESDNSTGSTSGSSCLSTLAKRADLFLRDLDLICTVKDILGKKVVKLSKTKLAAWVKVKVRFLADVLQKERVNVGSRVAVAGFIRKEEDYTQAQFEKFAFGILCNYLPEVLHNELSVALGLKEVVETKKQDNSSEQPSKKSKNGQEADASSEDYSKVFQRTNSAATEKKLTAAQKRLQKVDKTGMKNISSYFTRSTSVPEK